MSMSIFNRDSSPDDSLILIDELECGIHPSVQRKLADVIQHISWTQKKQFIITTHSPTLLSAFPQKARKLIDVDNQGAYECIRNPAINTVFSKMDAEAHPLVTIYCEDELAKFIIKQMLIRISREHKYFDRLSNIVYSGAVNEVFADYKRHKNNYSQFRPRKGYCCVLDGDYKNDVRYRDYHENENEYLFFLYPYTAPEKFLINSYLISNPNNQLSTFMQHSDHHLGFDRMVELGLAADKGNALNICWSIFETTQEYETLFCDFRRFIIRTIKYFSDLAD